ncbi:MAG: ATP-binding protein [Campylobacterota bacterium]|nr:ATP-binding protein [Campylobacterota bacterium]
MKIKISTKVAIGSFLVAGIGVLIFAYLSYSQISDYFKQNLLYHLSVELESDTKDMKNSIKSIKDDVKTLAESNEILGYIRAYKNKYHYDAFENKKLNDWEEELQKEFLAYIKQNEAYFQIRFIGIENNGKELVRIDKISNEIVPTKDNELQEKGSKKYFSDTIALKKDELYISNINLNKERGNIVFPIIPTIRIATPVYVDNILFGIIIINANTDILFNLDKYRDLKGKNTYLANHNGDYLFHNNIDKTFSFEFGKNINIKNDFKLNDIYNNDTERIGFYERDDLAFFAKKIQIGDYFVILARSAANIFLKEQSAEYTNKMFLYIILVTLMIALFSAILTRVLTSSITKLTKRAKIVASSNGEEDIKFNDLKSNDEIGELSTSIEIMVRNLVESKKELSSFASSLELEVRKRTKEQEMLLSVFDKGDAVLFKWNNDEKWSVDSVSSSILKLTGYHDKEFLSGDIVYASCIHKEDLERVVTEVTLAVENNKTFFEHKPYRLYTVNHGIIWVHDNTIIVRDENTNEVTHFLGYLTDITELKELNEQLEQKVAFGVEEIRSKDELLAQQSKLAAMGEMIGAIAHQWRQPLNALAVQIQFMEDDFEDGLIDEEYLKEYKKENMKLINFMSKTIDDFRNFFRVDKVKTEFYVKEKIEETINILSSQLEAHNISLELNGEDFNTLGYESEFQQVILNIINNSKDALIEKNINNPFITIDINKTKDGGEIDIKDNAGGIPDEVINRVFDPYFTTKEQGKGTGLGLYMSKMIIEDNMDGNISVKNIDNGAIFSITLKQVLNS